MDMITVMEKTLDEALTKALLELETTSEHLHYEIVQNASPGLFGILGSKPCIIKACVMSDEDKAEYAKKEEVEEILTKADSIIGSIAEKEKEKKPEKEKREVRKKEEKKTDRERKKEEVKEIPVKKAEEEKKKHPVKADEGKIREEAEKFLNGIFEKMEISPQIEMKLDLEEGELSISLVGEDMGILIGKRGQTLDSLQYLTGLVVNRYTEGYLRVKIDTENYRERRRETLETLARSIAHKVKHTRQSISLEPMNPYERRVIHSTLQNDRFVYTKSEGEDPFRHVVVMLKNEGRYDPRRRGNRRRENRVFEDRGKQVQTAQAEEETNGEI